MVICTQADNFSYISVHVISWASLQHEGIHHGHYLGAISGVSWARSHDDNICHCSTCTVKGLDWVFLVFPSLISKALLLKYLGSLPSFLASTLYLLGSVVTGRQALNTYFISRVSVHFWLPRQLFVIDLYYLSTHCRVYCKIPESHFGGSFVYLVYVWSHLAW